MAPTWNCSRKAVHSRRTTCHEGFLDIYLPILHHLAIMTLSFDDFLYLFQRAIAFLTPPAHARPQPVYSFIFIFHFQLLHMSLRHGKFLLLSARVRTRIPMYACFRQAPLFACWPWNVGTAQFTYYLRTCICMYALILLRVMCAAE